MSWCSWCANLLNTADQTPVDDPNPSLLTSAARTSKSKQVQSALCEKDRTTRQKCSLLRSLCQETGESPALAREGTHEYYTTKCTLSGLRGGTGSEHSFRVHVWLSCELDLPQGASRVGEISSLFFQKKDGYTDIQDSAQASQLRKKASTSCLKRAKSLICSRRIAGVRASPRSSGRQYSRSLSSPSGPRASLR